MNALRQAVFVIGTLALFVAAGLIGAFAVDRILDLVVAGEWGRALGIGAVALLVCVPLGMLLVELMRLRR